MSPGGSSCQASRSAFPHGDGWRILQGGQEDVGVDVATLNTAMAKARGTLEFDAQQRAYGGHMLAGDMNDVSIVPLRHGTRAVGLLAAVAPALDIGTFDAVAGVVAIAIERAQFMADRDAAELERQKADLAATLLASLSHDLRTPLTAIRLAVENLAGDLPVEARGQHAGAALDELDRLTRLFQDILDMARIDAARGPGRPPVGRRRRCGRCGGRARQACAARSRVCVWRPMPTRKWRSIRA